MKESSNHKLISSEGELLRVLFKGKWRVKVIENTLERPARLSELRRLIPGCSKKVLIDTLHDLEALGILERQDVSGRVRRVEYRVGPAYLGRLEALIERLRDGQPQDDLPRG